MSNTEKVPNRVFKVTINPGSHERVYNVLAIGDVEARHFATMEDFKIRGDMRKNDSGAFGEYIRLSVEFCNVSFLCKIDVMT